MAQEEYQIPIFLINGQLDSGKTRFISDTIAMGQFAEAKNKLLIVCEEGEEEYSEKLLKDNGVDMVVLEKEELTEALDGRIYTTLRFCNIEALDTMIKLLQDTKKMWEADIHNRK